MAYGSIPFTVDDIHTTTREERDICTANVIFRNVSFCFLKREFKAADKLRHCICFIEDKC